MDENRPLVFDLGILFPVATCFRPRLPDKCRLSLVVGNQDTNPDEVSVGIFAQYGTNIAT